jgi:hypothetical protein
MREESTMIAAMSRISLELGHLEQADRTSGLLHLVDGIVHRGDQAKTRRGQTG